MLQRTSSVFVVYRRKTLTGPPDPTYANSMDKPCIIGGESGQGLDINRETSFVEAATGRYNDQNGTKIETQIN